MKKCKHCKSEDVLIKAWVYWNNFEFEGTCEEVRNFYCKECMEIYPISDIEDSE